MREDWRPAEDIRCGSRGACQRSPHWVRAPPARSRGFSDPGQVRSRSDPYLLRAGERGPRSPRARDLPGGRETRERVPDALICARGPWRGARPARPASASARRMVASRSAGDSGAEASDRSSVRTMATCMSCSVLTNASVTGSGAAAARCSTDRTRVWWRRRSERAVSTQAKKSPDPRRLSPPTEPPFFRA
jgi:hypothetical protein